MVRVFALFLCICVWAGPVHAARFSGSYLLQMCGSTKEGQEIVPGGHIACQAYIAAILDYQSLTQSLGTAPSGVDFCVPDDESLNAIQTHVMRYLFRNKHEQGPFVAAPSVALALKDAYPCGKPKARSQPKPVAP